MRTIAKTLHDYWVSVVVLAAIGGVLAAVIATQQPDDPARSRAPSAATRTRKLASVEAQSANAAASAHISDPAVTRRHTKETPGRRSNVPAAAPQNGPSATSPSIASGGAYVDCRALGHVVSAEDPVGDVDASGNAQLAARFGSVDLTRVSVAVAGTTLCADFTSAAPPTASTFYSLLLSQKAPNSAAVRINAGLPSLGPHHATLQYPGVDEAPNQGIVPAKVGVAGTSTSVLIDRNTLPRFTPFPRFLWTAEAVGQTGLRDPQQVFDQAPDGYQPAYP